MGDQIIKWAGAYNLHPQRLRNGHWQQQRIAQRRQRHKHRPITEGIRQQRRGLQAQARLAHTRWPQACEQARISPLDARDKQCQLSLAADQRSQRGGDRQSIGRWRERGSRQAIGGAPLGSPKVQKSRTIIIRQQ